MDKVAILYFFKNKIDVINVINDRVWIGVKLSAPFTDNAKSEEHFQNVLRVVETDRKNETKPPEEEANWIVHTV